MWSTPARGAAIITTGVGSNEILIYPSPNPQVCRRRRPSPCPAFLPTRDPQGVSCFGDTCLVADNGHFRIFVVQVVDGVRRRYHQHDVDDYPRSRHLPGAGGGARDVFTRSRRTRWRSIRSCRDSACSRSSAAPFTCPGRSTITQLPLTGDPTGGTPIDRDRVGAPSGAGIPWARGAASHVRPRVRQRPRPHARRSTAITAAVARPCRRRGAAPGPVVADARGGVSISCAPGVAGSSCHLARARPRRASPTPGAPRSTPEALKALVARRQHGAAGVHAFGKPPTPSTSCSRRARSLSTVLLFSAWFAAIDHHPAAGSRALTGGGAIQPRIGFPQHLALSGLRALGSELRGLRDVRVHDVLEPGPGRGNAAGDVSEAPRQLASEPLARDLARPRGPRHRPDRLSASGRALTSGASPVRLGRNNDPHRGARQRS